MSHICADATVIEARVWFFYAEFDDIYRRLGTGGNGNHDHGRISTRPRPVGGAVPHY